jgi:hypothetical protein
MDQKSHIWLRIRLYGPSFASFAKAITFLRIDRIDLDVIGTDRFPIRVNF